MKNQIILIILPLIFAGCGRVGDGEESPSTKKEWSILQSVESENRLKKIESIEKCKIEGYWLICVPDSSNHSRIWIMMDPENAPFYKQMPGGSYSLSKKQLEDIRATTNPTTTVYEALRSHVCD